MSAQQLAVVFDPAATQINWSLAGNLHTTHGTFQLKRGRVTFDLSNSTAAGELVVAATSGASGNEARDKHMHKDVLETDKFPEIRLRVTKLESASSIDTMKNVRVLGELTIHGAIHPLSIPLQVSIKGSDITATGALSIPYVDWGMKDPSNFLFKVNKTVEVELRAAGHITK